MVGKMVMAGVFLGLGLAVGYWLKPESCKNAAVVSTAPGVAVSPAGPTQVPTATEATPTPVPTELVFDTYNSAGVGNKPTAEAVFTLTRPRRIYLMQNYHWNGAKGKTPGEIGLRSSAGVTYGPWSAAGAPGQGGVANAYWTVYPNVELPAGTYTIVDSDPDSWAQNAGSRGVGMSQVYVVK